VPRLCAGACELCLRRCGRGDGKDAHDGHLRKRRIVRMPARRQVLRNALPGKGGGSTQSSEGRVRGTEGSSESEVRRSEGTGQRQSWKAEKGERKVRSRTGKGQGQVRGEAQQTQGGRG